MDGTLLRAARLVKMQRLDMLSISEETDAILAIPSSHISHLPAASATGKESMDFSGTVTSVISNLEYMVSDDIGDSFSAHEVVKVARAGQRQHILDRLDSCRCKANRICDVMTTLTDDDQRSAYLIQHFLVDCLSGVKQQIGLMYLSDYYNEAASSLQTSRRWKYVFAAVLPTYLLVLNLYIFLFGVSIGSRATDLW